MFLSRSWKKDHLRLSQKIIDLSKYINEVFPLWLLFFPEGTRLAPEKLEASQDWSLKQNKHVFTNLLYPRFRGFLGLIPIMSHSLDSIMDTTIIFENNEQPSIMQVATGEAEATIRFYFRRFPISELPEDSVELREWLLTRWIEKEEILNDYAVDKNSIGPEIKTEMPLLSWVIFFGTELFGLLFTVLVIYMLSKVKYGLFIVLATIFSLFVAALVISRRVLKNSTQGLAASEGSKLLPK